MTKENWRKIGQVNIRKGFVRITLNYNIRQAVVLMPNPTFNIPNFWYGGVKSKYICVFVFMVSHNTQIKTAEFRL